jgi:replicative DNA helicase
MMPDDEDITELVVMPNSRQAEEALIGAAIINPECVRTLAVSPDDFYIVRNGWIWDAILSISNAKKQLDFITLVDELEKRDNLGEIGGEAYLMKLINDCASSLHADNYAGIIQEMAIRRRVITDANELARIAYDKKSDMNDGISKIITSLATRTNSRGGAVHIKKYVNEFYDRLDKRCKSPVPVGQVSGIPTGLLDIDDAMDGFQLGEEVILSAPSGLGKSLLAFQMVAGMADHSAGAVYELEMNVNALIAREIAGITRVSTKSMRRGWVKDEDWIPLTKAVEALENKEIYVSEETDWNVMKLRADLARLKERANIKWFMLDYMDLLADRVGKDDIERMKWISTQIHNICKDLKLAGLVIQAMTKAGMQNNDGSMTNLGGAAKLISDADQIIFMLHDENEPTNYKLKWGKMRNETPPGVINLFKPVGSPRFENAAKEARL